MAKSSQTFNKKEKEKNRLKKRQDKQKKKEDRKANESSSSLDDMIAYVDENGNITDTPPDPEKKKKIKAENIQVSVPPQSEQDEDDSPPEGVVTYFDYSKGYGFIKVKDTGESIFTHIKGHLEEISEGNAVTFRMERGLKGMNAVDVKKLLK